MPRTRAYPALVVAALLFANPARAQNTAPDFLPDRSFRGSELTGWPTLGEATWRAQDGEITGTAPGGRSGWLLSAEPYQDVAFFSRFRCVGECDAGVLLRAERTADGLKGVFISLRNGDLAPYSIVADQTGKIVSRTPLRLAPTQIRVAPPEMQAPTGAGVLNGHASAIVGATAQGVAGPVPPAGVRLAELEPPPTRILPAEWNSLMAFLDANIMRPVLNGGNAIRQGATDDDSRGFGPVALYVGSGEVRFRDVSFKDLNRRVSPPEQVASRFRMQQLDEFYYAWDAAVADIDRDGVTDVVAGPFYYLGPTYAERREIYLSQTYSPSTQYVPNMITHAHDFTGDGWPDVLATESRQMVLYVNPRGEPRRWDRHLVLPGVTTELTLIHDVDRDGRPEIVYAIANVLAYAKYDPARPTEPWAVHRISTPDVGYFHGLGVGDVNGDGRADVLQAGGWWEQPAGDPAAGLWRYHPVAFGRWNRSEGAGGGNIAVFDVDGDGLNDVVSSLSAHGFGLAWFRQRRDAAGTITFERRLIMDDYAASGGNAGGVTFSQLHSGVIPADIDGDGVLDFVTGKRFWGHRESYTDSDPHGPAVLYWYRTVRDAGAPGGVRFVPELIHNRSGVGSLFKVADVNADGAADVITSANRGTFVFWGTRP